MDKYLGKKLDGRYEINELVGIGGMANVYKAHDIKLDRMVAIKILKDEFLSSTEFVRRFRNESKAIAVLSHPNIVKVIDVNFGDRIQYIVMEYIDGITLKEFINSQEVLTWKESVHFIVQILRALQHAHEKGIVHRDVKPQNIMLLQDGTIKVMDFGIATFARDDIHTKPNKALGSVHYISPEQARGEATDEKADIYSVGVILFEMLTGVLPFQADNAVSVALMQMKSTPKRPRELNNSIPKGLEEITIRAMQKDTITRYQSASEMLRDLDSFKRNPSVVFNYKYFTQDGDTKYFDAVKLSNNTYNEKEDSFSEMNKKEKSLSSKTKSKSIPILAGIASAFVIIMILILIGFSVFGGNKVEELDMPNFVGKTVDEIRQDARYSEFKIEIIATEYTNDYDKDIIFDQNVKPGQNVKKNTSIKVKVSLGKKLIEIPDIYNSSLSEAEKQLKNLGFNYKIVKVFDDNVAVDRIVKTDPARGEQVVKDTEIKLYVSLGKDIQKVTVPNLIDKTESQAKSELSTLNLKYNISYIDNQAEKGKVVSQSIAANTVVNEGTLIEISISNGTPPTKILNFNIDLPSNAYGTFRFTVYLNGVSKSTQVINIGTTSKFNFSLEGSGSNEVAVTVSPTIGASSEVNFVKYNVNFNDSSMQITYRDNSAFNRFNSSSGSTSSR